MTKPQTIDDRLERIAVAEERQATALEGILEAVTNFKFEQVGSIAVAGVQTPETAEDEQAPDETPAEETAAAEPEVEEAAPEADTAEEAATEDAPAAEEPAEDGGDDPLGDGKADEPDPVDGDAIEIPDKLSTDHVRNLAREVMEKDGKPAVFEVLAEIGGGYKAVGEITDTDLEEAFVKMTQRLRG